MLFVFCYLYKPDEHDDRVGAVEMSAKHSYGVWDTINTGPYRSKYVISNL
jgi:hypothetical protein